MKQAISTVGLDFGCAEAVIAGVITGWNGLAVALPIESRQGAPPADGFLACNIKVFRTLTRDVRSVRVH